MGNFIIIDSNKLYAEKLKDKLSDNGHKVNIFDLPTTKDISTGYLFNLNQKLKDNEEIIVLLKIENKIVDSRLQGQEMVELVFWLRCKLKYKNPIVFYSLQSINQILVSKPDNFIILSPGCYHIQLPFNEDQIKRLSNVSPLEDFYEIKSYLKPRIDIDQTRHDYANYTGMNLMLNIAKQVHNIEENKILDNSKNTFDEFYSFRNSLDYYILSTYFDLEQALINEDEKGSLKLDERLLEKRTLLIDDLAEKGWKHILRQVIYNDVRSEYLESVTIKDDLISEVESKIKSHKPHLILLDLRLENEKGKIDINKLGGYKLLKHLKSHPIYKGLPIIMFTASSKAEITKILIDAGANAVWTKPGLDESLSKEEILSRYKTLIKLIVNEYNPDYSLLSNLNDNPNPKFQINTINFENVRNLLFQKLDFIKYRLQIYEYNELKKLTPEPYKSTDAIYIDTNSLITGEIDQNYADIISSVYILSILTSKFSRDFINKEGKLLGLPKVVVMNTIFDEVIKLAKVETIKWNNQKGKRKWTLCGKRAPISQIVLKELFENNFVRTELNNSASAKCTLKNPKENPYADGYILDEISSLILTRRLNKKIKYKQDTNVICVTGDVDLSKKLKCFTNSNRNSLILKTREEFIDDILKIDF